jgi:hypothetical protein
MPSARLVFALGFVLVAGCSFEASCNGGHTLNEKGAEKMIRDGFVTQAGVTPTAVECPKSVKIEKGGRFDCTVAVEGLNGVVTLEQKDAKTYVEIVQVSGLLISNTLEAGIGEKLKGTSGLEVKVDCGPRVRASTPGATFRCGATSGDKQLDVDVTVTDNLGNADYEVVEGSIRPLGQPPAEAPAPAPAP